MALATLGSVKSALSVTDATDDALLGQLQQYADAVVADFCGRSFAGGTFTEYHPAGTRYLFLTNFPVTAVTSVKADRDGAFGADTLLPAAGYRLLADRGVIVSRGGGFGGSGEVPGAVQVVYTTPTGAVPDAIGRAYVELVGVWYRHAKTSAADGQLNIISRVEGGLQTTLADGSVGFRIPPAVVELLEPYRVPPV